MSFDLMMMLGADEGTRLRVYDDATGDAIVPGSHVVGHPTIGTGRCLDTHGITATEAAFLLAGDVAAIKGELFGLDWFATLNATRQMCICAMTFQLGMAGMLTFKGMIAAIRLHDYAGAADHMLSSKWAQQTPDRVQRMAALMRTGAPP